MAHRVNPLEEALRAALAPKAPRPETGLLDAPWQSEQQLRSSTILGGGQLQADFIFIPLFTAILGTGGFTLFGTTISYAAIASAIATTAIVAGAQYLLTPKPPKPEDGRQPLTQAIPYRFWGVGTARIAGAMMLWEALDSLMFSVQAIVGHRINAYLAYYLNDDNVELRPDGSVISPGRSRYGDGTPNRVFMYTRLGLVPETPIAEIVTWLGSQGSWTNDHRLDGTASVGMICRSPAAENFNKMFPYGKPALSVVAELALCWDFRDPAQDPDDESTWQFTKNSALILAWHECFNPFGTKRDFRKAILPVLDMWQEEADVCDELIPRAVGGFEKRYECSGFDSTEHDPKGGTNAILASCDGWMCERGDGALLFVAGKFREKYVATLRDADIVGHTIQHDVLPEEEVNRFVPKFTYPATDYTTTDTDFFEDVPAQITAGRVLPQPGDFIWVQQWRQARRLGKREFARMRAKKRGSLDVRFTGINAIYAPWVRLETPRRIPSLNGKLISNRRSVLAVQRGGFQMTFIAMPDDIDAWTPEINEGAAPPVPPKPVSEGLPQAIIDTATAISDSGTVYIRVALTDPNRDDVTPVVRYRVADTGGGVPGAWIEQRFPDAVPGAGLIVVNTNPVPPNILVDVEGAFIGGNGSYGDWSDTETILTSADDVAPQALVSFGATGNNGRAALTFQTAGGDTHLSKIAIYRVPTGNPLDKDVHDKIEIAAAPGTTFGYTDGDGTIANLLTNGDFAVDANWNKGTGWTIAAGLATHAAGTGSNLAQTGLAAMTAVPYRLGFQVSGRTAGSVQPFTNAPLILGTAISANGLSLQTTIPSAGATQFGFFAAATFDGSVDDAVLFQQTPACAPQGVWDYHAFPLNISGVEGPAATPVIGVVIV